MSYTITRTIELDAGHRVPQHKSKCRSPHGHRYVINATVEADELVDSSGASNEGMVSDFSDLKELMVSCIHTPLDHGFIVWEDDNLYSWLCNAACAVEEQMNPDSPDIPGWKIIPFPYIPTAENIAKWCFEELEPNVAHEGIRQGNNARLIQVDVHETPNAVAAYFEQTLKPNAGSAAFNMKVQS